MPDSTFEWVARDWHRRGPEPVQWRSWTDPCPRCGAAVTAIEGRAEFIRDNPTAVISMRNPACQYDEDDPDSPDCICSAFINPAPDPMQDRVVASRWEFELRPCGHLAAKVRMYEQRRAVAGTLGALYEDWAALEDA